MTRSSRKKARDHKPEMSRRTRIAIMPGVPPGLRLGGCGRPWCPRSSPLSPGEGAGLEQGAQPHLHAEAARRCVMSCAASSNVVLQIVLHEENCEKLRKLLFWLSSFIEAGCTSSPVDNIPQFPPSQ
jgi:hypothetical protein